jgi:hypothetical protein
MNAVTKICRKYRVSLDLGSDGASPYQRILRIFRKGEHLKENIDHHRNYQTCGCPFSPVLKSLQVIQLFSAIWVG